MNPLRRRSACCTLQRHSGIWRETCNDSANKRGRSLDGYAPSQTLPVCLKGVCAHIGLDFCCNAHVAWNSLLQWLGLKVNRAVGTDVVLYNMWIVSLILPLALRSPWPRWLFQNVKVLDDMDRVLNWRHVSVFRTACIIFSRAEYCIDKILEHPW